MKPKSIILYPHEVRAALENRLSLIVRPVKPQLWVESPITKNKAVWRGRAYNTNNWDDDSICIKCPLGSPGQVLWGKETCVRFTGKPFMGKPWPIDAKWKTLENPYNSFLHKVGNEQIIEDLNNAAACITVSSTQMPSRASRLTLEVVGVGCKRVQKIGLENLDQLGFIDCWRDYEGGQKLSFVTQRNFFHYFWDATFKKHPWDQNPWAWFGRVRRV